MKRAPFVAVAAALALSLMGSAANAVTIDAIFNFVPTGTITANTGDIDTATSVTSAGPDIVTSIVANNIGLVGFPGTATIINITSPTPLTMGATFTKTFTTSLGAFLENLTVTSVSAGASALSVLATGMITGPAGFDPTPVSYSASYTQNLGPGGQINASFNDSTLSAIPLPGALPLFATGLAGLGLLGWRRKRKAQAV